MSTINHTAHELERFAAAVFAAAGLSTDDAAIIGRDLVKANLRGLDSHGISRMPMYLERLRRGLVNPRPAIRVEQVAGAVSSVDGDNAMGFLPSHIAMDEAMRLAESAGIGLVGVRNSTHFGMGALYVLQALERGFVSMVFTNSSPAIAMHGGRTAFLGASPIAAGVPAGPNGAPFVMDMSMTVIARGKIRLAAMRGEPIAEGLALDVEGRPTTDAQAAFEGVCLPFGGIKGSVLGTMMDLMAGALTGANYGGDVKSLYFDHSGPQNVGHLFFAIRPDLFMPLSDFDGRMDAFHSRIKTLPRAAGVEEILMPGEPEARTEARRRAEGIPVTDNVIADLKKLGAEYGVSFPSMAG
ncbi:MAG: Ldh family oxidoreductase [Paracoccus denitrificans]|uniref:Ldh family oxidoreductase n=1 Tax=Paracoccus denitrificans TaxID=266 RepID=A0A533HZS4_PARDE|nr:MAG: Ldh family oxidoreductase [Paracoccus denitrificans]